MKVLSLKTLNLDGCSGELIHSSLDSVDYVFQFDCGLVASSSFWKRLRVPLKVQATSLHISHHLDSGHTSFGSWCFLGFSLGQNFISEVVCGGGCDYKKSPPLPPPSDYTILRSDIINSKTFGAVTLQFSAAKSIFCSCSGFSFPARCLHVRVLIPPTRKLKFE